MRRIATLKSIQSLCATLSAGLAIAVLQALLLIGVAAIQPVYAATVSDLYVGTVRVADSSEATRQKAYGDALGVVLVKLSGRRDAASKAAAAIKEASRYVQRYGYVAGGRLEVGFDSTSVNAVLDQAGLPLWGQERPVTLVVYPQALLGLREAMGITEIAAKARGVPLVWSDTEFSEQFAQASPAQLEALAKQYGADALLLARGTSATSLNWQMVFGGATQSSIGAADEGPQLAGDVLARYYGVQGKDATSVALEVAGINSIDAYGTVLNLLGKQLLVRSVSVLSLTRDVLTVKLELRGAAQGLQRALLLDNTLAQENATEPQQAGVLRYRYNR